jgi:CubicO group peptidase (beta-lactamase class C family)
MISHALVKDGKLIAQHDATFLAPWWSFTKTVLAVASLVLVRNNLLSLDEPLPGRPFTLRQLLRHQAGLTDYGELHSYHTAVEHGDDPWSDEEMLVRADADRLRYPPGEGWRYSNIGYLYVRRLIEDITAVPLHQALQRLVLGPLGIDRTRLARSKPDLVGVRIGDTTDYDPRWVYHGLLVGPLHDAALLLDRIMTSGLLSANLMEALCKQHPLGGPMPGRPWLSPGYGLGVMTGVVEGGALVTGHTGSGPGSVIAVYHAPPFSCAVFQPGDDQGLVETEAFRKLA